MSTRDFELSWEAVSKVSVPQWLAALRAVDPQMTPAQRQMLIAHASAPGRTLSMLEIAKAGGYASHSTANSQYGKLGRHFADHFGAVGLVNTTQAMAYASADRDDLGHFQWTLRQPLKTALFQLGWLTRAEAETSRSTFDAAAAAAEINADQTSRDLSVTTRQALIDARVGQGKYRADLLRLWKHRCALTGARVEAALVASHILPWSQATPAQRLDPFNGLLLAAHVDRLFDVGLISFDDDGRILRAGRLSAMALRSLGLDPDSRIRGLKESHTTYLAVHRAMHGFDRR